MYLSGLFVKTASCAHLICQIQTKFLTDHALLNNSLSVCRCRVKPVSVRLRMRVEGTSDKIHLFLWVLESKPQGYLSEEKIATGQSMMLFLKSFFFFF